MKLNYILTAIAMVGIISCSNNQIQKDIKEEITESEPNKIIWIETTESISNFNALVSSNHLYYLRHMSVEYDNYGKDFWKANDTINENNWTITRVRKGACKVSKVEHGIESCIEHQKHVINKKINRVINFSGNGSGYFATIDFIYNEKEKLIEYRSIGKVFYLKYDKENNLIEVLRTEIRNGITKKTGIIKFKRPTSTV